MAPTTAHSDATMISVNTAVDIIGGTDGAPVVTSSDT